MYTTFSIQIAGIVLKRAIACDRVWQIAPIFFYEFSKYFCTPCLWDCQDRIELLPVLGTDCLSLLRLLPPGTRPLWMMECMSRAFPKWKMYSAKSSGNSTWSCNEGSTRVPPECPGCSEIQEMFGRIGVQAELKPFLRSSSFRQGSYPSFNWPMRSNHELCLELFCQVVNSYDSNIFSMNCIIMSKQSDHKFWYFKTTLTEFSWLNVNPFPFTMRNGHKRQC